MNVEGGESGRKKKFRGVSDKSNRISSFYRKLCLEKRKLESFGDVCFTEILIKLVRKAMALSRRISTCLEK